MSSKEIPESNCSSFPTQTQQWCDLILEASANTGIESKVLAALILVESGGQPEVISKDGAVGLMQIMPRDGIAASFQCVNGPCFASRPSTVELKDPSYNVQYGSEFLAGLINKYGLREGLFRYGPSGVGYSYADKIIAIAEEIK